MNKVISQLYQFVIIKMTITTNYFKLFACKSTTVLITLTVHVWQIDLALFKLNQITTLHRLKETRLVMGLEYINS